MTESEAMFDHACKTHLQMAFIQAMLHASKSTSDHHPLAVFFSSILLQSGFTGEECDQYLSDMEAMTKGFETNHAT